MEAASRKWRRRTTSHIFQNLMKSMLETKMGRKRLLSGIVESLLSISVSPTIAEQAVTDDFDIKVSRGPSESRRRALLVSIISPYHRHLISYLYHRYSINCLTYSENFCHIE